LSPHTASLTPQSPFAPRLWAYLQERFPPAAYGVLIVSYYSCNQFLAEALTAPEQLMRYSIGSLMGAVTMLCIFFHLRVFDEHKDYEEDCRHYPERVLSRGLITLKNLKVLGAIAIGLELLLAALVCPLSKPAALVSVLVALGFSLLMLKEFFVPRFLRRHFLLYASSHMLIMPLLAMVVFSFATGRYLWEAPGWYWVYSFVGFFVTFNWEISRKIRAPEEEREGVDSYTKIFGTYGAAYAVLIVRAIDTGLVALVGWHLGMSPWFYAVLVLLYLVCMISFVQFRFQTSPKTAKRMETFAGIYIIAFDLAVALELGVRYGVEFVAF
jgi:4-hydroxybenzoate polyprenyltransferase